MFSSWPWTRDIRPRGLQRRPRTMERFLFSPTQDIKAIKKDTAPGIINMTPQKMCFAVPTARSFAIPQQTETGKESTAAPPKNCVNCPSKACCKANKKGQKVFTAHIWQEYLDIVESIRKTDLGKQIYAQRKETIERVFADAKEKHAMRYTHHRGLAAVTRWGRLKYAAMSLKKLAQWSWKSSIFALILVCYHPNYRKTPAFAF